jgi:phosphinothricin acetyltransferase
VWLPADGVSDLIIRAAVAEDAAALAAIYNEGIADRVATFETAPRSAQEARAWPSESVVLLAAECNGQVVGWARVSSYSDRCVYQGVGEHGIYVARNARGQGVGVELLRALCVAAEQHGLYKLTSRVFTDNADSRAIHRAAGFEEVGIQRRHGRLDGTWKDCVLVERLLGEAAAV